jgi:hypothetical protein
MWPRLSTRRFRRPHQPNLLKQVVGIALAAFALMALGSPHAWGGFLAPLAFDAGAEPYAVVVGDFNRDGKPDLAVANSHSNMVSVLLGNGVSISPWPTTA